MVMEILLATLFFTLIPVLVYLFDRYLVRRTLSFTCKSESIEQLRYSHGFHVEDSLIIDMADEIEKEIEKEMEKIS